MSDPETRGDVPVRRRGAPDGFEQFYEARLTPAVRQVALMVGSIPVAEDIVHEAMTEVLTRWDRLDNPGGYLHRCTVNGAMAALKRRARDVPLVADVAAAVPSVEFIEVSDLLTKLTDRQRVAIVLRYYADLTEVQIAEAMGCRPGTVGPLLTRAHAALRKEVDR